MLRDRGVVVVVCLFLLCSGAGWWRGELDSGVLFDFSRLCDADDPHSILSPLAWKRALNSFFSSAVGFSNQEWRGVWENICSVPAPTGFVQ
ncbi:hypothetical protein M758_4G247700 [Ceratodon purpureus]|nr:hypothetical protein M758_4G247700 [Ceratodon purpureus]